MRARARSFASGRRMGTSSLLTSPSIISTSTRFLLLLRGQRRVDAYRSFFGRTSRRVFPEYSVSGIRACLTLSLLSLIGRPGLRQATATCAGRTVEHVLSPRCATAIAVCRGSSTGWRRRPWMPFEVERSCLQNLSSESGAAARVGPQRAALRLVVLATARRSTIGTLPALASANLLARSCWRNFAHVATPSSRTCSSCCVCFFG
mmetsp:Transcript_165554/g.531294  ORF Transcript_165554/g.531294 Transcript_165554/m.531294 type:complete len:205 (+) Transcript_165554:577-1191(+)